ncbi:DC1 domain-containing protein [Musa troglodytarum]|uniref:DC1 domain-containing protein n=1 Tax=Musa troglodytarum TaxID=320322 RepID=A0A9E7L107_9LILI|nr:DC1 domain-containing protein [Musa troglodytarum]
MSNLTAKKPRKLGTTSTAMDLPATPNPNLRGDQLLHFSHPQHPLLQISLPYLFTCMGCKEYGAGRRFRCQTCGFDLHDFCALAPPALQNHPFHHKHQLVFFAKPGGFLRSKCDVCGKAAKGFGFRCTTCSFEMHPCCAAMRVVMNFPTHEHPLGLSPSAAVATGDASTVCNVCQRKRSGQVYRCAAACGYCLHAVCAKDMVNGLYVHGLRSPDKPNNMLGTAAKLATQALVGIIGGLIEGIGEGIGEVLMDNIGRGSCRSIKHN